MGVGSRDEDERKRRRHELTKKKRPFEMEDNGAEIYGIEVLATITLRRFNCNGGSGGLGV
jgi:hypothetical protein